MRNVTDGPRPLPLSERERQILQLAADGLRDKQISAHLSISPATLRTYWDRLRGKMDAGTRSEAIAKALMRLHAAALEELKMAELRYTLLVEAAEDYAVFFMDPSGKIATWNVGVLRVLGFDQDDFVGQDFSVVFSEGDKESAVREMQMAAELGRYSDQRWHRRNDSSLIWVRGSILAIRNNDGDIQWFAKIMRDETQTRQLMDDVERLQLRVKELSK